METKISRIDTYTDAMAKTLYDKIWWIDKIDSSVNTIIDFGCADAAIMSMINKLFPNRFKYIGIDNNPHMLLLAEKALKEINCEFELYKSINDLDSKKDYSTAILIMNSVVHELLNYLKMIDSYSIFHNIFNDFNFKHIAIRDMHYDFTGKRILKKRYQKLLKSPLLKEFEDVQGSAREDTYFVEFLLKYRYTENWDREVNEKYLWHWIKMLEGISKNKYTKILEEHYSIPFIKRKIKEDFNIELRETTHAKVLYDRII